MIRPEDGRVRVMHSFMRQNDDSNGLIPMSRKVEDSYGSGLIVTYKRWSRTEWFMRVSRMRPVRPVRNRKSQAVAKDREALATAPYIYSMPADRLARLALEN